eukprot:5960881-Amphidinium_carterae.1
MFADDLTMVVRSIELLSECIVAVNLLEAIAGLHLNWRKTKVLPIGFASMEDYLDQFRTILSYDWVSVDVVASLRFLGYWVGRGDVEMDSLVIQKLKDRSQAIPGLKLGSAANAFLGNVVAFSCAWHVLQVAAPSIGLRREWHFAVNKLIPGGTKWLGDALFLVKDLLGWPAQVQHIDLNSTVAKIRTLLKKLPRVLQCRDVVAVSDARASRPSQLWGWRQQGCLTSLTTVCTLAQRLGL